jgi:hypothetical protein
MGRDHVCTFHDGAALGSGAAEDDNVLDVVKGLEVRHAAISQEVVKQREVRMVVKVDEMWKSRRCL